MTTDPSFEQQLHRRFRDKVSLSSQKKPLQPAQSTAGTFLVSTVLPYMLKFFYICFQILALPLWKSSHEPHSGFAVSGLPR